MAAMIAKKVATWLLIAAIFGWPWALGWWMILSWTIRGATGGQ